MKRVMIICLSPMFPRKNSRPPLDNPAKICYTIIIPKASTGRSIPAIRRTESRFSLRARPPERREVVPEPLG